MQSVFDCCCACPACLKGMICLLCSVEIHDEGFTRHKVISPRLFTIGSDDGHDLSGAGLFTVSFYCTQRPQTPKARPPLRQGTQVSSVVSTW
jgi:hypothetical protein